MQRSEDSVRPSILLLCFAFLCGAGFLVYKILTMDHSPPEVAQAHRDGPWLPPAAGENDTWHHRDWRPAPGENAERPPGPAPEQDPVYEPPPSEDRYDPQVAAMHRSFHDESDGGIPLPFYPTTRFARLLSVDGTLPVPTSSACEVRVLPVEGGIYNCLVRVMCGDRVVYPNGDQTAGYAPCEVQNGVPVTALDERGTSADGDPIIRLDMSTGTLEVGDNGDGVDAFHATFSFR
jgi:hypothetical protein